MFGQGKFQNGVLIEPIPEYRFDPQDLGKLEDFRNRIWWVLRLNMITPLCLTITIGRRSNGPTTLPLNIRDYSRRYVMGKTYIRQK